jgi:hypothetical protein
MRNPMSFAKSAAVFLLLFLCMAGQQARAQNQTPANLPLVGWTDPATGLTWTKEDNGSNVDWYQAIAYCTNLRLGGYSDWRLPTIDELRDIYDPSIDIPWTSGYAANCTVKGRLKLSGFQWSSSRSMQNDGDALIFAFNMANGNGTISVPPGNGDFKRALCVRR